MGRELIRFNRFGFAEYDDMGSILSNVNPADLKGLLSSIIDSVLSEEDEFFETLSDEAQASFVVPLSMASKMISSGGFSAMELVSAACTVRYSAKDFMSEFPPEIRQMLTSLPS